MLDGHMSYHRLNLVLPFSPGSATTASYTVKIADDTGTVLDTIVRTPTSDIHLPITLWVVA